MYKIIDLFSDNTGWTYSQVGFDVPVYTDYNKNLMSGINDKCAAIRWSLDRNHSVEKSYSIDVTGYTEIHLTVNSLHGRRSYTKISQFRYKIDFGFGIEFYLNTRMGADKIVFAIPPGQTTLSKIKIICLHDDTEYLHISACYAVKPECDIDILQSICEQIGDIKIKIGTVTAAANDTFITLTNPDRDVESDMLISFGNEMHQIKSVLLDGKIYFGDAYSGNNVLSNASGLDVYLVMTPKNSIIDNRIIIPGVSVSCVYRKLRQIEYEKGDVYDTYTDTSVQVRKPSKGTDFFIQIDAEAEDASLLSMMQSKIEDFLSNDGVIITGEYHNLEEIGDPVYLESITEGMVPKYSYRISVWQGVNEWPRMSQVFPVTEKITISRPV